MSLDSRLLFAHCLRERQFGVAFKAVLKEGQTPPPQEQDTRPFRPRFFFWPLLPLGGRGERVRGEPDASNLNASLRWELQINYAFMGVPFVERRGEITVV